MRIHTISMMTVLLLLAASVAAQVPYERLKKSDQEPDSWLTYSGNYSSHRHASSRQINRENASKLKPVWVYQLSGSGRFETSPIVVDGVMYVSEPPTKVSALDARTGRKIWSWERIEARSALTLGHAAVNRGVAVLGDRVFVGTLDCYLVALDAKTGAVRWQTKVGDNKLGYAITAAPLAIDGRIVVGISGGDAGIRGYLDAYDPQTGKQIWRTWTVPEPGRPGSETWEGDSWKTGGGATWLTGSYDPELNLLYWPTGNPGPDWNGDVRPGDNLYTCSLLAIDPSDGSIRWHFQYTPHDVHDWDSNQIPVLMDLRIGARPRKVVGLANRNGFYYLLDRKSGEFLLGTPFGKQTWAKNLDPQGRPVLEPGSEPSFDGSLVWPGVNGVTNWHSPSYSPQTGLFYVPVMESGAYFFKSEAQYIPGTYYMAGGARKNDAEESYGAIRALDPATGKLKWEFRLSTPAWAGVLSTGGGLVFSGSREGNFYALDALSGKPLWDFQTGAEIAANPISFVVDGRQHIAIASGHSLFVFGLH